MKKNLFSNINLTVLQEIEKFNGVNPHGINLSHLWVLEQLQEENEITGLNVIFQFLIRKGYCTESRKITKEGKLLYETLTTLTPLENTTLTSKQKKESNSLMTAFDIWWSKYPLNDEWGKFLRSTTLRYTQGKNTCKKMFDKIVKEGEYSEEDLINILEYKVAQLKKDSLKQKRNCLKYLGTVNNFLDQRRFEGLKEVAHKWKNEQINPDVEDENNLYGKTNTIGI